MKIYSGNDTNRKRILIDDLRRTKGANTLYVSHYCFVLDDRKDLIFYYNPIHFWDKCPIEKVADYVWTNLETDCAIFKNVDPDKSPKSKALDNKISYPIFLRKRQKLATIFRVWEVELFRTINIFISWVIMVGV